LNTLREGAEPTAVPVGGASLPPSADIDLQIPHGDWQRTGLRFSNGSGEEVLVGVTASPAEVFIDRRKARKGAWHKEYPGRHAAPVRWIDGRVTLRVLFDRSVLEVFANGGEKVLTDRVYPTSPYDRVGWIGATQPRTAQSRISPLRSVWPSRQGQP
jgi:sucrose-6-phosphate hydrolase SacC (GH32 family)